LILPDPIGNTLVVSVFGTLGSKGLVKSRSSQENKNKTIRMDRCPNAFPNKKELSLKMYFENTLEKNI
jgi:hypothetical protein